MKIVFRVNFYTVPGQSIWLKLGTVLSGEEVRLDQVLPLHWLNDKQWQIELDVKGLETLTLEYSYQLRQEDHQVVLDEWTRVCFAQVDPADLGVLLLEDDWCSAGTVDYAFETKVFQTLLPERGPFALPVIPEGANHTIQLRMSAVPSGLVPCMLGNVSQLGDWNWSDVIPLEEVAENTWRISLFLPTDDRIEYKYGLFDAKRGCAVSLESGENRVLENRFFHDRQWTIVNDECYRREISTLYRGAGVAIPVFSLRSEYGLGVGEFADLKLLADWASEVGLKLIQILPINDTTSTHHWTDSYPYSAISVFALHPLYLRIDDLGYKMPDEFLVDLDSAREWLNTLEHVDYEEVMKAKAKLLRRVFAEHGEAITTDSQFQNFLTENREWIVPYAVFCLKRDQYGTADFHSWREESIFDHDRVHALAEPSHSEWAEISYHIWLQYELDRQLKDAVAYLHQKGLVLKGDLPIGIDRQSVDAWSAPHLFKMDSQAGAPPDAFAVKGQNWGFPTYDWQAMRHDDFTWWRSRFVKLSRYFDAYRIDHILGFFRIWQIPYDQVEGIMGWFDPALPVHIDEFNARGVIFDFNRFCRPYLRQHHLLERFGDSWQEMVDDYLDDCGDGIYQLREGFTTQRQIVNHFSKQDVTEYISNERVELIRDGLLDCVSDVMFFEVPGSGGTLFHPRCSMQMTHSFQELDPDVRWRVDALYTDYFFRRQEGFWKARGLEKLPTMRRASSMLLCGEDLGMVPTCVAGVLKELGILSLEIQRMPKSSDVDFSNPACSPYMSVVSSSTHDMSTLRGWWREDPRLTATFASQMLGIDCPRADLSGEIAANILTQHIKSPAMWAVFPLQDILAIDEGLRHADPDAERINVPAIIPYYWRYRMHLGLDELVSADEFNRRLRDLLRMLGR